jgi:hypothetical protein
MGPTDPKGRPILSDGAIDILAMTLSSRRGHKDPTDIVKDMHDMREVLETLTSCSYITIPIGVIESMLKELRKQLTGESD